MRAPSKTRRDLAELIAGGVSGSAPVLARAVGASTEQASRVLYELRRVGHAVACGCTASAPGRPGRPRAIYGPAPRDTVDPLAHVRTAWR